jgi:flagellar secretion chaperone FliS
MNPVRAYRQADVRTASPMRLVIMLYEECLRTLERAEKAFDIEGPGHIEAINTHLLHAQDVITELAVSLDMEKGGPIAANLHNLYDFAVSHLSEANVKKDRERIREVHKVMTELLEAWQQVEAKSAAEAPAEPAAPPRTGGIRVSG